MICSGFRILFFRARGRRERRMPNHRIPSAASSLACPLGRVCAAAEGLGQH